MVTLTSIAAEQMQFMVTNSGIPGGIVRLYVTQGGCCGPSFALDVTTMSDPSDLAVVQDGFTLYVQKEATAPLENVVIDFQDGFKLRGLQTSGCCG